MNRRFMRALKIQAFHAKPPDFQCDGSLDQEDLIFRQFNYQQYTPMSEPPVTLLKRAGLFLKAHVLAVSILLVGFTVLISWRWHSAERAGNPFLFARASLSDIENTVAAAGSLAPSRSVDVGAQVSGQLEKLLVSVGEVVDAGQLVARIDASVQAKQVEASRASLLAQEAQLSGRQAALELAEATLRRQRNMFQEKATSQQELDNAVNNWVSAQSSLAQLQAQIAQSRAGLASAEAELGYSQIYAPMAGTVVSISVKEGQTLNASQTAPTVMTIADLSTMTVETDVSEADVSKLKNGMPVYFTTLGNGQRRWYGHLRQILPTPTVTNNVVLYTALFDVANNDSTLLSGMTAQVFFVTSSARGVLTVPLAALSDIRPEGGAKASQKPPGHPVNRNAGPRQASVKVRDAQGNIVETSVVVGVTSRVLAEVVSGLHEGDEVVAGLLQEEAQAQSTQRAGGPPIGMRGFR